MEKSNLTRHSSLIKKRKSKTLNKWLREQHSRCLSLPDLKKVKKEWDSYQTSTIVDNDNKLQVDLLNIRMNQTKIKRPQIRLRMGTVKYLSKRTDSTTGDWNEGFMFIISYHAQLFNTIEFDLYDKPYKYLPTIKHIGKAKLKLSKLDGKDDISIAFLPIYEYSVKRLLPSEVQHILLKASTIAPNNLDKKIGDLNLIGSVQVRIRYHFQQPVEQTIPRIRRWSFGRGDLAQEEGYIDDLFKNKLTKIMTSEIPNPIENHIHEQENKQSWFSKMIHVKKKPPRSSRGKRYGFSQHDSDDSHTFNPEDSGNGSKVHEAKEKAKFIIHGVNFGDRNFATQWMKDSFEDVALSHPLLDKLIGLVVSKQTHAMIRAIIKTANAFGQGFRVTGIKLMKAFILTQKFYESLPIPSISFNKIQDTTTIENACHYFSFALVAYGWRGLCYLGQYSIRNKRSNRVAIIRYLDLHPEDLLGYEYSLRKGASFQPSYYVALDKSRNAIVLSIRGTWSLYDAITDLVCEYTPWKGGLVHSGILASAQWFYTSIIPQIFRYIHYHQKEIESFVITGHSLGGGTASILTMMVADHINELRNLALNPHFELKCYNYAPVAVCSPDLSKKYKEFICSFICQDDIVGRLSYGTAMKLKELILDMISAYGTLGGFRKTMTDPKKKKVCFEIMTHAREKLNKSTHPFLYVPGEIIHIKRSKAKFLDEKHLHIPGATSYSLYTTTYEVSNEMRLTKTCIEDHMLNSYHDAFKYLKEHCSSSTSSTLTQV